MPAHPKGREMSSYIQNVLIADERVLYTGRLSVWALLPEILWGTLLLPFFGIGLVVWLLAYLRYISTELAITNKRVIAKFGFISRRTVEINLNKVESLQVDQNVLGRLFNYGSLVISGAGTPQAPIPGIYDPLAFRKAFMEAQEPALKP